VTVRIGAKLPNSGSLPETIGIGAMARALESAGFASAWVSDHIVMPASIESRYPFAADGRATWPPETPYIDALIALALAAAATERVRLGTAVLVLPLRNPVEFAKQAASIDVASGGRLEIGVGAGWLREEFDALNVPFARRGARLEEWLEIARACWTGRPDARRSEWYELPGDVVCLPTPAHEIPLLVGGHSRAALERAGRVGDGWLAQQSLPELAPERLREAVATMRGAATAAGRDPERLRVVLRLVESAGRGEELARALPELGGAGVDEIIVDIPWDGDGPDAYAALLRDAAAA
jgi:probable F420-dependent oxidoreductase